MTSGRGHRSPGLGAGLGPQVLLGDSGLKGISQGFWVLRVVFSGSAPAASGCLQSNLPPRLELS